MVSKEEIERVWKDTYDAYEKFVELENKKIELLNSYYSDKYDLKLGESEVYQVFSNKKILVHGFCQDNGIDDKPSIIGRLILPFGVSKQIKTFFPDAWQTDSERRGDVNGNIKNSDNFVNVNGNF
jgi:hypothetical protein